MGAMSRNKGKVGEREIAVLLAELTGCDVWPPSAGAANRAAVWTGYESTVEGSPEAWAVVYRELIAA